MIFPRDILLFWKFFRHSAPFSDRLYHRLISMVHDITICQCQQQCLDHQSDQYSAKWLRNVFRNQTVSLPSRLLAIIIRNGLTELFNVFCTNRYLHIRVVNHLLNNGSTGISFINANRNNNKAAQVLMRVKPSYASSAKTNRNLSPSVSSATAVESNSLLDCVIFK